MAVSGGGARFYRVFCENRFKHRNNQCRDAVTAPFGRPFSCRFSRGIFLRRRFHRGVRPIGAFTEFLSKLLLNIDETRCPLPIQFDRRAPPGARETDTNGEERTVTGLRKTSRLGTTCAGVRLAPPRSSFVDRRYARRRERPTMN